MKSVILGALVALALAGAARAEVVDVTEEGFTVRHSVTVSASKARAWEALMRPGGWWNGAHSFSRDANNLSVDPERRCLCERLPNGGWVSHLQMIQWWPGERVVYEGGLGPMSFSGATGHLVWEVSETGGRATITWTYSIGGYFPRQGGLQAFAPAVDGMVGEQVARLGRFIETGRPDAP